MDKRIHDEIVADVPSDLGTPLLNTLDQFELAIVGGGIGDTVL